MPGIKNINSLLYRGEKYDIIHTDKGKKIENETSCITLIINIFNAKSGDGTARFNVQD